MNVLDRFTDGPYRSWFLNTNSLTTSKDTLPLHQRSSS
jgi:hypothetical protein